MDEKESNPTSANILIAQALLFPSMLKKSLPALLLVLAIIGGYLLFSGPPEDEGYTTDLSYEEGDAEGRRTGGAGLSADGLAPQKKGSKKRRGKPYRTVDPRTLPKGTLFVTPVGPDDKPVEGSQLRMYVEPIRAGSFPVKLPTAYDEETGAHRFSNVPAGNVNVRIYSDHVRRKIETVRVRADQDNRVTIRVEPAGTIKYDVMAYDKTRPDPVRVTLYDADGQPVKAWYKVRTPKRETSPKFVETMTQGPEGVILGLKPGVYRLKVTSEAEEWDEASVTVEAGQTHAVSLEVRR